MNRIEILAGLLPVGRDNAVHKAELCKALSLNDRELRLLIERLRRTGCVICSDDAGYYRPAGIEELRAYCLKCRKRRRSDYAINKSAELLLKRWEDNQDFGGASLLTASGGEPDEQR